MSPCRLLLAFAAFAALPAAAANEAPPVRFFIVASRVDLDASGAVLAVEARGNDPEAVRKAVAAKVRALHFTGASSRGKPAAATTYVTMFACAEKSAAGYVMSFRYAGHGPTQAEPVAMGYPVGAERSGTPATYDVFLLVQPDGTAVLEEMKRHENGKSYDRDFRRVISQWAKVQRFLPEVVDGSPVATRLRTGVNFRLTWNPRQPQDPIIGAKDCAAAFRLAEETYGTDEAIDSPVAVSP
jgi:hypothetical protein